MCVHFRRNYRVAQLTPSSAGTFAAAAVLNVLGPADWSVSQEVELAVEGLSSVLHHRVPAPASATVNVAVHANHIELVIECDHPHWVTDGVRVRPRRPFVAPVECALERPAPPPARPALWPELAGPRGREEWSRAYRALAELVQSVGDADVDLGQVLEVVGRGILASTCFTVVATNLAVLNGVEVVSVVGDDAARESLLGVVESERHWQALLAQGSGWGSLRYSHPEDLLPPNNEMTSWRPTPLSDSGHIGWDADSTLVAPMYVDGRFIGALSVDLPGGSPRPGAADLAKLEMFAEHAAIAIERARVVR